MDDSFTKERLERALANMEWFSRFQSVMVKTLVARTSDHSPILISFCDEAPKQQTSARPLSWNAKGVIQSAWENDVLGGGGDQVCKPCRDGYPHVNKHLPPGVVGSKMETKGEAKLVPEWRQEYSIFIRGQIIGGR
jgi:hypothetical protein